jgi:putative YhdH/YhfP family quinone oxidoreductase
MARDTFKALVVRETEQHEFTRSITDRTPDDLPDGDVLVQVQYSSLNYKDALSASGHKGVTRTYPHTPGIDAAGVVSESRSGDFKPGDEVIVTGYDLGMNTPGGFGRYIRVPAGWVVPKPASITLREAMIYGTAGFTAAQCLARLQGYGLGPEKGDIFVTGSTGGVGSMAVCLLAKSGYQVVAVTGKPEQHRFLRDLGAKEVIGRDDMGDGSGRPLLKPRWAGGVDTVGGPILETAIKSIHHRGAIACCGNVASPDIHTTVFPFILRGVSLFGIDSANCPYPERLGIWEKLAGEWKPDHLDRLAEEVGLDALDPHIGRILEGKLTGRILIRHEN